MSIAIMGGFWHNEASETTVETGEPAHFYIEFSYNSMIEALFTFIRYFQLLNTLIPISLFVTAEMIKFFIAWFIAKDYHMFSKTSD